jgi:preprotein translocase subunit SecY
LLSAFLSAFRTPDLRKKLLFTVAIIAIYRLGATLPSPGVSYTNVQNCITALNDSGGSNGVFTLLNLFSGGALLQLSVFALGIMPYITASIILQLLTVVIPRLEQLRKEGQAGQAKITQYTRYLTLGLAILQASAFIALARTGQLFGGACTAENQKVIPENTGLPMWLTVTMLVTTMTAGTGVIMWLGELITDRGVGNGMSVLIFTSIAARLPTEGWSIFQKSKWTFVGVMGFGILVITAVVFIEQAQRRVPVQYAKRMIGRRMYGGTSTYIPLKVNQAGVIPVIFASSLLYLPQLALQFWAPDPNETPSAIYTWINKHLVQPSDYVHISIYFLMIIFFTYFYVSITFNPTEVADNMKKYGGFVPGIRPGKSTADYLSFILSRITLPGALYLGIISVLPNFFIDIVGGNKQNFPFGGTAVLIIVGVGLETVKQIESQLMQRNYEGFLR